MSEATEAPAAPEAAEVRRLVEACGGVGAAAEALGVKAPTLRTWRNSRPIPAARLEALREAAARAQAGELVPTEAEKGGALALDAGAVREALALVTEPVEAKDTADRLEVLRAYLRKQKAAAEVWREAAVAKLWAERRCGELLPDRAQGRRSDLSHDATSGLDRRQAHRYRLLAEIPLETWEAQLEEWEDGEGEPSTSAMLKVAKRIKRGAREVMVEAPPSRVVEDEPTADATPDDDHDDSTDEQDPWAALIPPSLDDYQAPEPTTAAPVVEALEVEADDPREVARLLAQSLEILTAKAEGVAELGEVVKLIAQARERAQEVAGR